MKKLKAEIKLMKMAFLAISLLMMVIFGFMMAVTEFAGVTALTVAVLVLILAVGLLSLAAAGVLPFGSEEDSGDEDVEINGGKINEYQN